MERSFPANKALRPRRESQCDGQQLANNSQNRPEIRSRQSKLPQNSTAATESRDQGEQGHGASATRETA